jgi:membrane-bound lytic murein transglycosylase D
MRVGTTLLSICVAVRVATAQPEGPLDSLLSTWQAREVIARVGDPKVVSWIPLDTTLSRVRLKTLGTDLPVFQDDAVADAILLFGGPRRNHTELLLGLAAPWMPMVEAELREAGLSTDLKYLPLAMSAMNMQATSPYGEAGPWMLTYPVAVRYGLVVTDTIDQRHDMALSTTAAVKYLKHLTTRFGKENALLAFLCGPANLQRAKARSGNANGIERLYPFTDEAERARVPAFMAVRYLAHYADALGIRPVDVQDMAMDTLRTGSPVRADAFTRVMGIDAQAFAALNPVLVGRDLPANAVVRVPRGIAPRYTVLADSIARASAVTSATDTAITAEPLTVGYTVEPGDNLGGIAEEYGVTVAELKEWNALDDDVIRAGAILRIHVSAQQVEAFEREKPKPEPSVVPKKKAPPVRLPGAKASSRVYVVKRGDTLSGIAKRYPGVSVRDIMRHNHVGENIRAGQKLEIPKP